MKDKYIIINKTAIQKRIEELEKELPNYQRNQLAGTLACDALIKQLKQILSQSKPLIPEIEKALGAGLEVGMFDTVTPDKLKMHYILNFKLDT